MVADSLGMKRIYLHPLAGVLSAFGMGLADTRTINDLAIESCLDKELIDTLNHNFVNLELQGKKEMTAQGLDADKLQYSRRVYLRYQGSDSALAIQFDDYSALKHSFEKIHKSRFSFISPEKKISDLLPKLKTTTSKVYEYFLGNSKKIPTKHLCLPIWYDLEESVSDKVIKEIKESLGV